MPDSPKLAEPLIGRSSLVRPKFSPGLMLRDDDLTQAVDYVRDLSRLMFRTLFGCGVMCGFELNAEDKCDKIAVTVKPGVALDCVGDPIQVREVQTIWADPRLCATPVTTLWVEVRRDEKCCVPRDAVCSPEDDEALTVCTRIYDGFRIRVRADRPDKKCTCQCTRPAPAAGQQPANPAGQQQPANPVGQQAPGAAGQPPFTEAQAKTLFAQGLSEVIATPTDPCYANHYLGVCDCHCGCEWVLLGSLTKVTQPAAPAGGVAYAQQAGGGQANAAPAPTWKPDYSVRRFVRPVLMSDPLLKP